MNKSIRGFTIVELLIVIVVIAILAAITIVSYNGIQTRANNTARVNELKSWQKSFELYKAQEGAYPNLATGGYCLGTNFPIGGGGLARCRDFNNTDVNYGYIESDNTALMTEIKKVSAIPNGVHKPVNGSVGPFARYTATDIVLIGVFNGNASDCPQEMVYDWTDNVGRLFCKITLTR